MKGGKLTGVKTGFDFVYLSDLLNTVSVLQAAEVKPLFHCC
jgi:hypothetical protein